MKEEKLRKLIGKYYNGESTEEEEKTLRDYLSHDNVPEGCEAERDIFGYYSSSEKIPEPSFGFEERILAGIDASDAKSGSSRIRRQLLLLTGAAAGFLILLGSYLFFLHTDEPQDTYSDPKVAYAETIRILVEVSSQLNHGTQALEPVGRINEMTTKSFESINKSTRIIQKSLKNLSNLQNATGVSDSLVEKKINK